MVDPDGMIMEKIGMNKLNVPSEEIFDDFLEKAKKKNPELGSINAEPYELKLKTEAPIR
jgi:hypothetical protein